MAIHQAPTEVRIVIIEVKVQTTNVLIAIIGCQTRRCIITAAAGKAMAIFFPKWVWMNILLKVYHGVAPE